MTNTSSKPNARSLSSLFSWKKSREMSARSSILDLDGTSPGKTKLGVSVDLTHFDDQNGHLSYTSLQDLLPTGRPGSPPKHKRHNGHSEEKPNEEDSSSIIWGGGDRLPIKNRLVEQAARAYLLPVSPQKTPPDQFFTRYWAKLTSAGSDHLLASSSPPRRIGCIHGCTHGCFSCLPTLLWVDLTRLVHALFSQLRAPHPQSLIGDQHAHKKAIMGNAALMSPSLVTPSLVK